MKSFYKKVISAYLIKIIIYAFSTLAILIFFYNVDFFNLFELYKEDAPWRTYSPIEKKYCYIVYDNGEINGVIGITKKKNIRKLIKLYQDSTINYWNTDGSNIYPNKGELVDVISYSEDSTYAKIKVAGRDGGNCYVPVFALHDTLPAELKN